MRIFVVALRESTNHEQIKSEITKWIYGLRIEAEVIVVETVKKDLEGFEVSDSLSLGILGNFAKNVLEARSASKAATSESVEEVGFRRSANHSIPGPGEDHSADRHLAQRDSLHPVAADESQGGEILGRRIQQDGQGRAHHPHEVNQAHRSPESERTHPVPLREERACHCQHSPTPNQEKEFGKVHAIPGRFDSRTETLSSGEGLWQRGDYIFLVTYAFFDKQ